MALHIASGSLVMHEEDRVTVQVGPLQARFQGNEAAPLPGVEFAVQVPFGSGPGSVSTTDTKVEVDDAVYRLLVVFVGAGAHGEVVQVSYSLSMM